MIPRGASTQKLQSSARTPSSKHSVPTASRCTARHTRQTWAAAQDIRSECTTATSDVSSSARALYEVSAAQETIMVAAPNPGYVATCSNARLDSHSHLAMQLCQQRIYIWSYLVTWVFLLITGVVRNSTSLLEPIYNLFHHYISIVHTPSLFSQSVCHSSSVFTHHAARAQLSAISAERGHLEVDHSPVHTSRPHHAVSLHSTSSVNAASVSRHRNTSSIRDSVTHK